MPTLIRRLARDDWRFERTLFQLDKRGYGRAVYRMSRAKRSYSLVVFSHELHPDRRTDRVIAEAWDATFVLYDGDPPSSELERLAGNTPLQEAGRFLSSELVLSRANRSTRFFDHVVERLASGRQPDRKTVAEIGYLMRTTAVYGNGKFGIADRAKIADRRELSGPFQAEMLAVYLFRCFTLDLVEHVARQCAPESFIPLDPDLRRYIGIGNSTGLGMAPFLVTHPALISNWMTARETALARIRSVVEVTPARLTRFRTLLTRAERHVGEWAVADRRQMKRVLRLRKDLAKLAAWLTDEAAFLGRHRPWDWLYLESEKRLSLEGQECLVGLLLEPYGDLVDTLASFMSCETTPKLDPAMTLQALLAVLETHYAWAFALDFAARGAQARFWYVSEEKLEPRLGERDKDPGSDKEMPLAVGRDMQKLRKELLAAIELEGGDATVAVFLLTRPELRHLVRRAQCVAEHPYGEIRDNLIAEDCLPIDLLRCKLSFFGASKFDPKSDRWTRITMYQGAPLPEDLRVAVSAAGRGDRGDDDPTDWCFPSLVPEPENSGSARS